MKRRPRRLSAAFVKTVTEPGRYGDGFGGFGLSLLVKPRKYGGVARSWSQRLWIDGKAVNVGLGQYPVVLLSEARQRALDNRRMVERGEDPRKPRRVVPTFAEAVEAVIELHRPTWKNGERIAGQWRQSLRDYALPKLGELTVDSITTADVLSVLSPIWSTVPTVAERLRTRIGAVMKWAVAEGYRTDNPAGDALKAALPRTNGKTTKHHRAAAPADVAGILAKVRESGGWAGTKLALAFVALTAARPNEVCGMTWAEVDGDTWTIPAARMKAKREHRVPLSRQALDVLDEAAVLARGGVEPAGLVFPAPRGGAHYNKALLDVLKGTGTESTTHGLRSAFSTWCADTGRDFELRETAIAHTVGSAVVQAYQRSDLHERRRSLMADWASFIMPT